MEHQEIRFRILYYLYQKHYSPELGHYQNTESVLRESSLGSVDKNDAYGDVVYLKEKGLIIGKGTIGLAYPFVILITSYGIDTVEYGVDSFVDKVDQIDIEEPIKDEIRMISKEESSTTNRVSKIVTFLESHGTLVSLIKEIAVLIMGR